MGSAHDGSQPLLTRTLAGYRFVEVFYPAGLRQARHRHGSASLSFVSAGRYEERYARKRHMREAATLVVHPEGEEHAVEFQSDVTILSIEFTDAAGEESLRADAREGCRSELIELMGGRLRRELSRRDAAAELAVESIVVEIVAEAARSTMVRGDSGVPRWLKRARDFVHENLSTSFTVDEAAAAAGVHAVHLSRVFREKMGCTVGEYVRRLRLERACGQLLSTSRTLCEVALDAGFADQSHFNRHFRAHFGLTPRTYRKLHLS